MTSILGNSKLAIAQLNRIWFGLLNEVHHDILQLSYPLEAAGGQIFLEAKPNMIFLFGNLRPTAIQLWGSFSKIQEKNFFDLNLRLYLRPLGAALFMAFLGSPR